MKRWAIWAFGAALLLATFLAAPYLLERRQLHERLLGYVEESMGGKVSVGTIGWRWLPMPAITITTLRAESDAFVLMAPTARLTVVPRFFLLSSVTPFRTLLLDPELTFKRANPAGAIPLGRLRIRNGTLRLPGTTTIAPLTLTAVNGTVSSSPTTLRFTLDARSHFAAGLTVKGDIDLVHGRYLVEGRGEGLDSRRLLTPPSTPDSLRPVVADLDFTAHLQGTGGDRFTLRLSSPKSPFTLQVRDQPLTVSALDTLTLKREGNDFAIELDNLSLSAPRLLRLNGRVARRMKAEPSTPTPEWSIDLNGADLDLGAIRATLLALFGQNPVAQKVCDIVRGGSAATARYAFTGTVADFHHLPRMKIWAEAKDVPIVLSTLGLTLDRASGPIAIVDGQLTGKGLTATIDQSSGENGALLLDLEQDRHGFTLDLDLSADLKNLHDVLTRIIPSPKFQGELKRFGKVRGRAVGHLRLGDDLRRVETTVEVGEVTASGLYDRLPWPFTVGAGQLRVAPQEVDWEGIQGALGPQRITDSKGGVTWKEALRADIETLDANLDLKTLFEEGTLWTDTATLALRDLLHGKIEALSGEARVTNTVFSGPIRSPERWQYQTQIHSPELKVAGRWLPAELHSREAEGTITQDRADFAGVFDLPDQVLFLSGNYHHRAFDHWHGDLEINGEIGERLGEWIKEKNLFPVATFPRLPFRLERFVVSNPNPGFDSLLAHGTIVALQPGSPAVLQVALSRQPDQTVDTLNFLSGAKQGTLSYQAWAGQERRSLLSWQGEVDFETLDALFSIPFLQSGRIEGAFSRLTDHGASVYSGTVEATGVRFTPLSPTPDLTINTLSLQGKETRITVDQADLDWAGTPATLAGFVTEAQGLHTLDLRLTTPRLSWDSIRQAFEDFTKGSTSTDHDSLVNAMRGTLAFDIKAFAYRHHPKGQAGTNKGGEKADHTFTASPFAGTVTLAPTGRDLEVNKATLCGINGQGTWHFNEAGGDNRLTFSSGQTPLAFEKALPCLGIEQGLISGPFSLEGWISGRPKQWRDGGLALTSRGGLIKRMNLLSKIFTAVNVTDYFTWDELPDLDKEGLDYSDLVLNAHIKENHLVLDRTIVKGRGVNLSGRGTIDLADLNSDLTFFIAPFKLLDSLLTNIPLLGKALGGPKESVLTFPVAVTGNIRSPEVTALAPDAVGSAAWEWFRDTMTLPLRILPQDEAADHKTPSAPPTTEK